VSVATRADYGLARARSRQWTPALASLLALLLVAAAVELVIDGSAGHTALVPESPRIAGWLSGLGERLGFRVFLIALVVMSGAYAGLLVLARRADAGAISKRFVLILIGALYVVLLVGPILVSTDVFSYIAYARMGIEHGINPYLHGPSAIAHDPIFQYVGHQWRHVATAYGPLYTLLSYPLAPLGVVGALWAMKLMALLAGVGILALTWRCARLRQLDPVMALLAVGANPLYVVYTLGGAHNDLLMLLAIMAAVTLTLGASASPRRAALAGAAVVAGALVKATAAAMLPFMLLSRRSRDPLAGAAVALALGALVGYAVFGVHGIDLVSTLNRDAAFVSPDSFATELAHLFGKPGVFPVDHDLLKALLVVIVVHLLWRTWRGYDWVAASGWTLLAISVTSTWLLPWYVVWPLPLAAVTRDRRLLLATLGVQVLFVVHQMSSLFVPVQ
jgi:alpha-1,6-mannosyltransferase